MSGYPLFEHPDNLADLALLTSSKKSAAYPGLVNLLASASTFMSKSAHGPGLQGVEIGFRLASSGSKSTPPPLVPWYTSAVHLRVREGVSLWGPGFSILKACEISLPAQAQATGFMVFARSASSFRDMGSSD